MLRILAATAVLFATAASGQITSYKTSNPAPIDGDQHKIVCEKEERIGSRLATKTICLTIAEWRARQQDDRNQTEKVQADTRTYRSQ